MTNKQGNSTNALYGFIRSLQKIIKDFHPENLIAVFDGPNNKEFREKLYADYKSHRTKMPEDLASQLKQALIYCEYAGIPFLFEKGVEADDVIASIAKWAEAKKVKVFICSSDKDLCQLISDYIFMINTHKNNLLIDAKKVEEIYGVKPSQIVDYLSIVGDTADNIPGIPGFGPKTARALLKEYQTVENLLENLDDFKNQKQADKIRLHKKELRLSQKLAQLILEVPFSKDETFFKIKEPHLEKLKAFYKEMNFSTLLKELPSSQEEKVSEKEKSCPPQYKIIDEPSSFNQLIEELSHQKVIAIDTETTQLEPTEACLVGIGFCYEKNRAYYVPTNGKLGLDLVLKKLRPLLENQRIGFVGHNIKYDLHILLNHKIEVKTVVFDTMIASYLLNPQNNRHGLDLLTLEKFGKVKTPIKTLIGSGKNQKSMRDIPIEKVGIYCCEDVDYTYRLKEIFNSEIEKARLQNIFYDIELPLIFVLIAMERIGMFVDPAKLKDLSVDLTQKLLQIEKKIFNLAGSSFNIKSPMQLGKVLFHQLKIKTNLKKQTTRADVLESLKEKHPIIPLILEYRALEKVRSTYADALPKQINKKTHRIHCSFMQTITATGRLSCKNPNLQNIPIRSPEGKKIRKAFCLEGKGWSFLSADYSQIELRLLAHMSQDPKLMEAFQQDRDIHASTAAAVFNVSLAQVTQKMRFQAKAVNFGIIYGQQAFGLSQELGIEVKEAARFIKTYFEKYPKVKTFLSHCIEKARKTGMAMTMEGRRRLIPEIHSSNGIVRAAAERLAVNTPLQGTQADIIKLAMIRLHEKLKQSKAHMVLQIHDELIFEVADDYIETLKEVTLHIMENIVSLTIPLKVNIAVGKNWEMC